MKKIILFLVMAIMTTTFNAQNLLSFRLGLDKSFETGSAMSYGPGASFQHGLSENLAAGLNFDFHLSEISGINVLNIEPRVDYYLTSLFNGIHIGSNIGFMMTMFTGGSSKGLQLGANVGYSHPLTDNLVIDLSSGLGYGMSLESGGGGAFGIKPVLSTGYKLGGS